MKKAVAYLVPFIEKEKGEKEQEMRAQGTWDENVSLHLEFSHVYLVLRDQLYDQYLHTQSKTLQAVSSLLASC